MAIRLYDTAWVRHEGADAPKQAVKNPRDLSLFEIGGYLYDIDGRAAPANPEAPKLLGLLSLGEARELGLPSGYNRDLRGDAGGKFKTP